MTFPDHYLQTADGVRLRYFDSGESLPAIIFANGLGGPVSAWAPYVHRWRGKYRVLSWDYRGLYGSILPQRGADLSVFAHARDVRSVLDAADVESATFLGWSMGVQVGLEFYNLMPKRIDQLVLINGTYGLPLKGVPLPFSQLTLPPLVKGVQKFHRLGSKLLRRWSESEQSFSWLQRMRVVAPGLKRAHFDEMISEFKSVDLDIYFDLLGNLSKHDAEHTLPRVQIPTLVVAGTRDILTPAWLAQKIVKQIPNAQLFMVPGGTHYSAAEYPEVISARIEQFLSLENQI